MTMVNQLFSHVMKVLGVLGPPQVTGETSVNPHQRWECWCCNSCTLTSSHCSGAFNTMTFRFRVDVGGKQETNFIKGKEKSRTHKVHKEEIKKQTSSKRTVT